MLAALALLSFTATALPLASPDGWCDGRTAVPALEEMLPRAEVALRLPGTEGVAVDQASRCIAIEVSTPGTARLVALLLRGVKVPHGVVDLRVVERAAPPEARGARDRAEAIL